MCKLLCVRCKASLGASNSANTSHASAEEILPANATVATSDLFMFLLMGSRDVHVCTYSIVKRAGKLFEVRNKSNRLQLTFGFALTASVPPAAPRSGHSDLQLF